MRAAAEYEEAVAGLEARGFGIKPGLERMEQLVRLLDNPQLSYPTIHIAGTNGKTSTALLLGAILAAHGLKSGVYTSPHLETIRERFLLYGIEEGKIVSNMISEHEFASTLGYLGPFLEMIEGKEGREAGTSDPSLVTYFELTTLVAFEWMAEKAAAVGIFEAGMGGRWDATNVIDAQVAVLCSIGVDHADYLGTSPVENADEKVGIIKMGSSVVSGTQSGEVVDVIQRAAAAADAKMIALGKEFRIEADEPAVGGRAVSVTTPYGSYSDLFLPLHGSHQTENLAVAIAAAESLRAEALDEAALKSALDTIRIPGRLEIVGRKPLLMLDGAHNPSAAKALAVSLGETFPTLSITLVASIFSDKDAEGILHHLAPMAERLILTRSSSPRAADPRALARMVPEGSAEGQVIEPLGKALDEAITLTPKEDMVLVTGSLYGVGQARAHLAQRKLNPSF